MDRENHSDAQKASGHPSEARYGPGGSAAARRREELAMRAATRGTTRGASHAASRFGGRTGSRTQIPRAVAARKPKAAAGPLFTPLRQRLILVLLAIAAFGTLLAIFVVSPMTRIRWVRLSGASQLLPEEAVRTREALVVPQGSNLFRLRLGPVEGRLSRLPWVASSSLSRVFPHGVTAVIKARRPMAHLQAAGQGWEIDGSGVIIRPLRADRSLPLIECAAEGGIRPGSQADAPGVAGALKLIAECLPHGGVRVEKVVIDQRGELCLNMSDNVAIRLGQEEALSTKIDYIRRIYDDKPGIGSEVQSIDLRWPESPSCVLRNAGKNKPDEAASPSPLSTGGQSSAPGRD